VVWVLVWVVLVLGAALVFFVLGRRLWRQVKALTAELSTATDRLTVLTDRLAELETAPVAGAEHADGVRSQGPRRRP
jgi:cytochrome c-type biogenesis protein CcmH/NrfG